MRQGNQFRQWVDRRPLNDTLTKLRVPMELEDQWGQYITVLWIDNGDGTYTLIPSEDWS